MMEEGNDKFSGQSVKKKEDSSESDLNEIVSHYYFVRFFEKLCS